MGVAERDAILEEIERSEGRACASDAACVLVSQPGVTDRDARLVVHIEDAERIQSLNAAHAAHCGAVTNPFLPQSEAIQPARCAVGRRRVAEPSTALVVK